MAPANGPGPSPRQLTVWAWICVALSPVGVVLSVGVLFGLASLLGIDLLPDQGSVVVGAATGLLLGTISVLVALAAPATAVVLAVRAVRAGHRSAGAARDLAWLLLVLVALGFTFGVGTFGLLGILAVGIALSVVLRRSRPR
jgi:hypothetical protein